MQIKAFLTLHCVVPEWLKFNSNKVVRDGDQWEFSYPANGCVVWDDQCSALQTEVDTHIPCSPSYKWKFMCMDQEKCTETFGATLIAVLKN